MTTNGIRHTVVNYDSAAIRKDQFDNYKKFKGTEFVITDKNQILPLYGVTVERVEYLIIWRDNNFDKNNPNRYSSFQEMLDFNLKIKKYAAFNLKTKIYYFADTDDAITFIRKKVYNKIILITNGGNQGKNFIYNARKIIGNNTIALVTCYLAQNHLNSVKKMENTLLNSKYCNCIIEFLNKITNNDIYGLKELQKKTELEYQIIDDSFHFKQINENAFKFPKFIERGYFKDLEF